MEKKMQKIILAVAIFTVGSFALGKFFDARCASSCIGEAFAANGGVDKLTTFLKEQDGTFIFKDDDGHSIHIGSHDSNDKIGGDEHNPLRVKEPLTESIAVKDLSKLSIKSYITTWKVAESPDDRVHLIFKGYLPPKEWTVKESGGKLDVELGKKGPLEAELQLPKNFSGALNVTNISGDLQVEKIGKAESFELTTVSGDLQLMVAPMRKLTINSVSGDVNFTPSSLSKDLEFDYNSVSGDLNATLKSSMKSLETESVSGNVNLKASKTVGFKFEMAGISSDFDGLPQNTSKEKGFANREATGSFGPEPQGELSFQSVSGDFKLEQAD